MLVLPGEAKSGPAGDQDPEVRGRAEQIGHERGGVEDVLEVVQHEQQAPLAHERLKPCDQSVHCPHRARRGLSDGWRDQIGIRDRREADEAGAIREILGKRVATARANRVLPTPPGPVRVSSRSLIRSRRSWTAVTLGLGPISGSER